MVVSQVITRAFFSRVMVVSQVITRAFLSLSRERFSAA
jgi:hypothetical protein